MGKINRIGKIRRNDMKILILVPCWHRPEIVAMFVQNLKANLPDYAELIPYFVLSEEDQDCKTLERITDGYYKTYFPNELRDEKDRVIGRLGMKKNAGLRRAATLEWDYFMDMGSDDIFTKYLWDYLKPNLIANDEYFGILHTYCYNPYLNQAVYLPNYHIGLRDEVTAQGQGRCIRRDVVEKCMPLWDPMAPFGMDGYSNERLELSGYRCQLIDNGRDPLVCQIKTYTCLTCWEQFDDLSEPTDVDWIKEAFNLNAPLCFDMTDFDSFNNVVLRVSSEIGSKREAFERVNEAYQVQTGEKRYASYNSYEVTVSRKFKNQ